MSRLIRYLVLGVIVAVSVTSVLRRRVPRSTRAQFPNLTGTRTSPRMAVGGSESGLEPSISASLPADDRPFHKDDVPIPPKEFDRFPEAPPAAGSTMVPFLVVFGVVGTLATGWLAYVPVSRPQGSLQASPVVQVTASVGGAAPTLTPQVERKVDVRDALPTGTPTAGPARPAPEVVAVRDRMGETELVNLAVSPGSLPASDGYVLSFDGTADAAVVDWGSVQPLSTRDGWAFEAWLRPASLTGPQSIYVESISVGVGARAVELGIGLNDRNISVGRRVPASASTARWNWTSAPLPAEIIPRSWFHLETTSVNGEVRIFINGERITGVETQTSGPSVPDRSPVSVTGIGVTGSPLLTAPFGGAIDEVRFWDGASARPGSGRGRTSRISVSNGSLIGYFPISASEAVGVGVPDATGNLSPLRLEGGLRWTALASGSGVEAAPEVVSNSPSPPASQLGEVIRGAQATWIVQDAFVGEVSNSGWKIGGDATRSEGGWLRLTQDVSMQLGSAFLEQALPTALGLTIDFDYAAWTEEEIGADGIVVFLADASSPAVELGQRAGSLGYGRYCQTGLTNAYLGVALDSFGTFSSNEPTCNAGTGSRSPNSVAVRGSGNWNQGYALITNRGASVSFVATGASARPQLGSPGTQHVTVTISGNGLLTVGLSYYGARDPVTVIGRFDIAGVPGQSALPDTVRIGVAGSTGGLSAVNEISRVSIRTGE